MQLYASRLLQIPSRVRTEGRCLTFPRATAWILMCEVLTFFSQHPAESFRHDNIHHRGLHSIHSYALVFVSSQLNEINNIYLFAIKYTKQNISFQLFYVASIAYDERHSTLL
jgi:hypothetical protein